MHTSMIFSYSSYLMKRSTFGNISKDHILIPGLTKCRERLPELGVQIAGQVQLSRILDQLKCCNACTKLIVLGSNAERSVSLSGQ